MYSKKEVVELLEDYNSQTWNKDSVLKDFLKSKGLIEEFEEWIPVYNYEGIYEISIYGEVKSLERTAKHSSGTGTTPIKEKILKQSLNSDGYFKLRLSKDGLKNTHLIHHLMAESFLNHTERSHFVCIDHIDEDKTNNNLDNLQIISKQQNTKKSFDAKLSKFKEGDWWIHNTGELNLILEVTKTHRGTLRTIPVYGNAGEGRDSFHSISVMDRKATSQEVEAALIKEAKKRGFKEGVTIKDLHNGCEKVIEKVSYHKGSEDLRTNALCGACIYFGGKWAEIIEEENPINKVIDKAIKDLEKLKV